MYLSIHFYGYNVSIELFSSKLAPYGKYYLFYEYYHAIWYT